ncbi:MAG: peptidoglycan DL-endopeptidase CwlO [Gaiellales bacterium]|nr:peptidoglycan DL-endopeptidase CwlO [Gaiellales bacterium]
MKSEEHERAAELIAMLLRDPSARASFRRSPADVCRAHGLDDVAAELAGRDGALQTLDARESRSSVAGVLIAAAAEGVAFFAFIDDAHASGGGGGALSPDVAQVVALTRPHMQAIVPEGNGGGAPLDVAAATDQPANGAVAEPPQTGSATTEPPAPDGVGQAPPPDAGGQPPPAEVVPETTAPPAPDLLHDPRLSLTDTAAQGLATAGPTSRTSEILTSLLAHHTVSVGAVAPDGSFTITMVDGAPVGPANIAARDLAVGLHALDPSLRPTAVGTPWSIDGKEYKEFYSDEAHQHHIEVGYGEPPPKPVPVAVVSDPPPAAPAVDPATPASQPAPAGLSAHTGGFAALAGTAKPAAGGTLSVAAVPSDPPAAAAAVPPAPAPAAGVAADAAAQLPPGVTPSPAGPKALAALAEARKYLGTPYLWGGSKPSTGFDCSGLMQWAYHQAGISIGRVTTQQIHDGVAVDRAHLRAGDMVFFQDSSGYVHHVGMYIGDDKFLHAPHTGDVVKISNLSEPYYAHQFAGGRRMDTSAPVDAPAGLEPAAAGAPAPAADVAAPARAAPGHGTGGFAALDGGRAKPRSTVQVMRAVKAPAAQHPAAEPAASGKAAPLTPDQLAAASAGGYPGDDAQPEQYAAWMAAAAQKAGLPPQLPIMAALTESGMHNLGGGDRDSIGFFQMRTSVWDQGEYAGYGQNPDLQLKWFITQALAIKEQRLARGETAFQADPSQWGNWIADVERPQEDLRGRYQTHLDAANNLLGTG